MTLQGWLIRFYVSVSQSAVSFILVVWMLISKTLSSAKILMRTVRQCQKTLKCSLFLCIFLVCQYHGWIHLSQTENAYTAMQHHCNSICLTNLDTLSCRLYSSVDCMNSNLFLWFDGGTDPWSNNTRQHSRIKYAPELKESSTPAALTECVHGWNIETQTVVY